MVQTRKASTTLTHSLSRISISKSIIGALLLLFVLVLSACGTAPSNNPDTTLTTSGTQPADTSKAEATVTSVTSGSTPPSYLIKVYFSKFPDSTDTNPAAVFPVNRYSPTLAVATFSIQLLIAGPTPGERSAGYFTELNSILSGASQCSAPHPVGGPDFTLTLNMKGSNVEQGTATLRFCRASSSPGIGADARITSEINATLKQFSTIKKVVILTVDGNCFGDGSGMNVCLK